MADFCLECVAESWDDAHGRNDLKHASGLWWALCEGCGLHAFMPDGGRLCGRPQTDFHHTDGPSEYTPAWPEWCELCVSTAELAGKDGPDA